MNDERLTRVLERLADDAAACGSAVSSETACEACVHLTGVTGVQLTLMNGVGHGESRYSTNEIGDRLEDLRFVLGEGPCEDAVRYGVPVAVPDLDAKANHRRWPLFVLAAGAAGARALFVFPLRSGAVRLGALVLNRTSPGPLAAEQVSDALVMTEVVMSLVLDELAGVRLDADSPVPGGIPFRHAEVYQATGMLSVQMGVSVDEALVRLRADAFAQDQPVVEVARDVVARRVRLDLDGRTRP
ncbi:GAF domain-containing protein [Lentzea sp. NBRC 105346]|uniref:GAF and ANTAR domain-containing protein n=1 Tax=Lentzea sp. NBRC 105346 TaxID=3032205 RepID=UPI0024A4F31A|nr:GAF and ANTAR domain-containing protein [Lentzea sp. NBRC 105346]GLZ32044.1 GAF domain-containing protein [Lentzea sp. NBRC 105346]